MEPLEYTLFQNYFYLIEKLALIDLNHYLYTRYWIFKLKKYILIHNTSCKMLIGHICIFWVGQNWDSFPEFVACLSYQSGQMALSNIFAARV